MKYNRICSGISLQCKNVSTVYVSAREKTCINLFRQHMSFPRILNTSSSVIFSKNIRLQLFITMLPFLFNFKANEFISLALFAKFNLHYQVTTKLPLCLQLCDTMKWLVTNIEDRLKLLINYLLLNLYFGGKKNIYRARLGVNLSNLFWYTSGLKKCNQSPILIYFQRIHVQCVLYTLVHTVCKFWIWRIIRNFCSF